MTKKINTNREIEGAIAGLDYIVCNSLSDVNTSARVDEKPIVSFGHIFCRGIAIKNGTAKAGMAHILPNNDPAPYIEKIINELGSSSKKFKAILISTNYDYKHDIQKCCEDLGVRIVDSHVSSPYYTKDGVKYEYIKDVLVLPEQNRVLIYTPNGVVEKEF